MSRIGLLLVGENYYARYALQVLLSQDGRMVVLDEMRDEEEALWLLMHSHSRVVPDIILFDMDFYGRNRDPVEVLKRLVAGVHSRYSDIKIICCMTDPYLDFIREAVALGVCGILKKDEVAHKIADVVAEVYEGAFAYTRSVSERAFGRIQGIGHAECYLVPTLPPLPLNRRLRRVAYLYCVHNLTASELAAILHLSESGVRRQIRQIYRILGVHNRRDARRRLLEFA